VFVSRAQGSGIRVSGLGFRRGSCLRGRRAFGLVFGPTFPHQRIVLLIGVERSALGFLLSVFNVKG
jgi:hypothetical protein